MKKILKSQNGVTLTSLVIAVAVLLILTGTIIVNVTGNLKTEKLRNMQSDIENLRDKVSTYYARYGKIPADVSIEYTNINGLQSAGVISEVADTGKFYVLDLSAMENVTLNYGKDYEKIRNKEATTEEQINSLTDLYIINEASHNIFYVDGIELDGDRYYTDYTADDIDTAYVDLRYVDNVEIPDGFYYVGGTKDTGLVISDVQGDDLDNSKGGNQFVWIPVENASDYVRNMSYNISTHTEQGNVEKLENVKISTATSYLPEGIQPSTDNSDQNEKAERQAVIDAGGFFISRFEAGNENGTLVSKKGANVWCYINNEDTKTIAKTFINNDNVKSALISGIQWDMTMDFVNEKLDGNGETFDVNKSNPKRHTSSIGTSGKNENDKVCNIYDLEGNCWERTAEMLTSEKNTDEQPVNRGGYNALDSVEASMRVNVGSEAYPNTTFRIVLYVTPRDNWSPAYDETATYTDKNGDTATIPEGFSVSRKVSENTIDNGLVVKASDGSEFVWIPVASLEDYKVNESYNDINISQNTKPDTDYLPDGIKLTDSSKTEEQAERETVVKAGGFYISRYEAGKEGTDTLVSKSGATVWVNQTHEEFKDIAKGFSGNTEHVKSALCSGTQWDMTMAFITANDTSYDVTVSNPYRHKGSSVGVQTSGQNPADIACNIYDLEGNCYEYVAEKNPLNSDFPFINRGGDYSDNIAASYRYYNGRYAPLSCSFRFVLYVK